MISKLNTIKPEKNEVLELALAYYQLSHFFNPLRLETLFSALSVLVKDMLGKKIESRLETADLKNKTCEIMKIRDRKFDPKKFELDWIECYSNERNSISHGRQSNLVALKNQEYVRYCQ